MTTETIRQYDPVTREWRTVTVLVTEPARIATAPHREVTGVADGDLVPLRHGAPRDLTGLSGGTPFAASLAYTAYDQEWSGPLADMRTCVKPAAIRTHRAAVVMPADSGRVTALRTARDGLHKL